MDQVFSRKIQMPAGLEGQSRAKMRHRALEYVHIWSIYHFLMHISTATISKCSCITPNLTWFCNLGILFGSLTHIDGQYLGDILGHQIPHIRTEYTQYTQYLLSKIEY
jgi:hypothetical protein